MVRHRPGPAHGAQARERGVPTDLFYALDDYSRTEHVMHNVSR